MSVSSRMNKMIMHMDGDTFFASVEVSKNPKLRGLPVVTGEERGIVSALSYEAKALGIVRGMPIFKVKRDFPNTIIIPGDYRTYAHYSRKMFDIVRRYTDDVEEYSIDECFADLTGLDRPAKMTYRQMAENIKKDIKSELDISVSIGLASTKVLAKVASKWQKPDGLTIIEKDRIKDFLIETPIEKIWGIGHSTSGFLKRRGIDNAYDLANKDKYWIEENLAKPYQVIWRELNGYSINDIDSKPRDNYHSIQKTRTFHPNTNDKVFLLSQLSKNLEQACIKARHYDLVPRSITFFLKNKDFIYSKYDITLPILSNAPEILFRFIDEYFPEIYKEKNMYRTTGVILMDLLPSSHTQKDLFGECNKSDKFQIIHKQIDKIEEKYGRHTVYLASTYNALRNRGKGTDMDDKDRDILFM